MSRARVMVVAVLVCVAGAVPALAALQKPKRSPAVLLSGEGARQVRDALEKTREKADARKRRARRARRASDRRRFAGLPDVQAVAVARRSSPGLFESRPTRLLASRSGERVKGFLGDYAARLDVPGEADAVVSSDLPLRVDVAGRKRLVDVKLVDRGGGRVVPRTPIVSSSFPDVLGSGLTVGDEISVRLAGADAAASGERVGQQVVYANAVEDGDLLATPLATGLETFVGLQG